MLILVRKFEQFGFSEKYAQDELQLVLIPRAPSFGSF